MYYPHLTEYSYRVTIDKHLELEDHWKIAAWCQEQFGDDQHCVTWRHALSGSPHISHPDFSTWLFMEEGDAILFRMRWGHAES